MLICGFQIIISHFCRSGLEDELYFGSYFLLLAVSNKTHMACMGGGPGFEISCGGRPR